MEMKVVYKRLVEIEFVIQIQQKKADACCIPVSVLIKKAISSTSLYA